jgi:translation initiation factor IF-3
MVYFPVLTRVNQQIRAQSVRLIGTDGTQIGIKSVAEALALARAKGADLVEVAPDANPPVCKLLDFAKFKYEQEKKQREARRNQKAGIMKEVRFSPVIGQHDLDVKIRHIEGFLKEHDKVRVTVFFRGRQMQHQELGLNLLKGIQARLAPLASVEQQPTPDRNRLFMTLTPKH